MQMEVLVLVGCQVACLTWVVLAVCPTWAALVDPLLRRSTKPSSSLAYPSVFELSSVCCD